MLCSFQYFICVECCVVFSISCVATADGTGFIQFQFLTVCSSLRSAIDIYILIMYPVTLLNSLVSLWIPTDFLQSCHLQKKTLLLPHFYSRSLFCFPCLTTLPGTSSTLWNRSSESRQFCLVLGLKEKAFGLQLLKLHYL